MKTYAKEIILVAIMIASGAFLAYKLLESRPQQDAANSCKTEDEVFVMQDDWMTGTLNKGDRYTIIKNWRECGLLLKKGVLVLYQGSPAHEPVVKQVAAAEGDHFRLRQTPDKTRWNIEINGQLVTENPNPTTGDEEKPYHFGSSHPPALKIYETSHQGQVDVNSVLLLSRVSPGDQDSGSLGMLNSQDIIAIVSPVR